MITMVDGPQRYVIVDRMRMVIVEKGEGAGTGTGREEDKVEGVERRYRRNSFCGYVWVSMTCCKR